MKRFLSYLVKSFFSIVCCAFILAFGYFMLSSVSDSKWQNTQAVEVTDFGSSEKFYFNTLENIEKHAYNEIIKNVYSMPESIEIPKITASQLDRVFTALLYDNPDLFFVGRRCTLSSRLLKTSCSLEYIITPEEYRAQRDELQKVCDEVTASLTNPDDEWQTELEIHDYIIDNCEYKLVEDELVYSSAYGALVNGEAACEGYSKAAKLLFDGAGIKSAVLSGISTNFDGTEGAHMWNAVKIYGDYYYLDCTWDDPVSEDGENVRIYSYFNINDDMIAASHSDFSYDFGCTATAANYYVKNGRFFSEYDRSCEKTVAEQIAKQINSGNNELQIRFANKEIYGKAVEDLIDNGRVYDILLEANKKTEKRISLKSIVYYKDPSQLTLTLVPETED